MVTGPRAARAEGSVDLSANGGKRAITEWRTSLYGSLLPRRTLLKVYANAGEVLNLGSSAVGVGSGDIVVWTPGQITAPLTVALPTPAFSCKTAQGTNGQLNTRAKELAGPLPNTGGYTPCTYTAATTGTYNVAFYGPLGGSSDSDGNPGTIAAPIVDSTQGSGVSMWDITVRNSAGTTSYRGRVFTDYLAQISGGNGLNFRVYSTLYAVTSDGFKYQIDLRGLDPYGFILYGNTVGYLNPDNKTPLYHDLVGLVSSSGGAKLAPPTGLLFFNPPDPGLPASIVPTPLTPSLTGIQFAGSAGGIYSSVGTGGNFVYSGNVGGVAEVVITANPGSDLAACNTATYDAALGTNRVIRAALPGGQQNLAWDGKDNNGTNVPVSYPGNSGKGYCFKATLHAGEYHFPLLDAENSMLGGPTITLLNAPGGVCPLATCRTAFFDDRGYKTTNGTTVGTLGAVLPGNGPPPSPYNSLTGFDTASTTIRKYGNDSNGFGDNKGLDLWTYFPSQDIVGQLYVQPAGTQDLAISKTHSGDFSIGVNSAYTIAVRNVGTGALSGLITVTDPVPAGLTLVSAAGTGWNCAGTSGQNVNCTLTASNLAAGASLNNITVTVTPQAAAATGTDIVNTATLANLADTNAANNTSSSATTIASADLAVTKSASPTAPAEGATVAYTITVSNNGPSTADSVSVAEAVPSGLTLDSATPSQGSYAGGTWTVGTLLKNATATLTLAATVNPGQSGQTIGNTATVSGGPYDYAGGNNTASASLTVPATVLTGIVTDQKTGLPLAGVSVQVTDSAAHVYTVTTDGDGRYTVTGSPASPLAAGTATVSVSTAGYVTATPSPTVVAGTSVTQDQALTPLSLSGTLTDRGAGAPIVGATVTLTQGSVTCTTTTTAGGAYSFTRGAGCLLVAGAATVSSTPAGYETASENPTILDTGPTTQDLKAGTADLVITKTDGVATVQPGNGLTYTITVVNNGSIAAGGVSFADDFPITALNYGSASGTGWACSFSSPTINCSMDSPGTLAAGASTTVTVTATVKNPLPEGTTSFSNYVRVSTSSSPEKDITNNEVSDIDTVAQAPDLVIAKTDGTTQAQAGQTLSYTIDYRNIGNHEATGVTIVDTLQSGVEIDANKLSGNTYSGSNPSSTYVAPNGSAPGTLTWTIATPLAVNATGSISLDLKVKSDVAPGSVVANRVAMTHNAGDGTDPNPGNNAATDSDLVIAPVIVLEKHVSGPTYVGEAVNYSIDWRNAGAATAKSVVITDTLPANTSLVDGSITDGGTESGGKITWSLGDQVAGANGTVAFKIVPAVGAGGASQTAPTLTTETGSGSSGSRTVTSSFTAPTTGSTPWCESDACAAFKGIYQAADGTPPTGWNDNPRLTAFNDTGWSQPVDQTQAETFYWTNETNLSAEWVTMHVPAETFGNFSFFRQAFCTPLNATGLNATVQLAGDDVSDIYFNGVYAGQKIGAGAAASFDGSGGIQSGINILAVQLLNNRHGGHKVFSGGDHSGLLFNLSAAYTGLRPFVAAPTAAKASESLSFAADPQALGGLAPFQYKFDFGDGTVIDYQSEAAYSHTYTNTGGAAMTRTATVTARDAYGCMGSDQIVVTVLPATGNLLANAATAAYQDVNTHAFTATSGTGLNLNEVANLAITKGVTGGTVPGQGVTYRLVVTNNGPNAVTGATVTDTVPAAVTGVTWECSTTGGGACAHAGGSGNALAETVDLPVNATATYTISGTVAPGATGTLANTATVTPPNGVTDLVSDNNSATASTSLTTTLDLAITKTSSPTHALPGGLITYIITATNAGPSDAVGAQVSDITPDEVGLVSWTCSASSGSSCTASGAVKIDDTVNLKSGGTLTYTLVGTLDPSAVAAVSNTATVTAPAGTTDSNPENNTATDSNTPVATVLSGQVIVNGTPQAGASVTVLDNAGHSYATTTNGSGIYSFTSSVGSPLAIGNASVMATVVDYYPQVVIKTLAAGANTQNLPFDSTQSILSATIGNQVWLDENGNGVQDAGEAGIANRLVELLDANDDVVATVHTDGNGGYLFTTVTPGSYKVRVTPSAGLNPTYDEDTGTTAPDSETPVTVTAGQVHLGADFGYNWVTPADSTSPTAVTTGAIGDRVWNDANGNGRQDPGESGIAGVSVTLYDDPDGNGIYDTPFTGATDGSGSAIGSGTTTTDAAGNYLFDALAKGAYVVSVTTPGGSWTQTGDPDQPGIACSTCDGKTTAPVILAPGDVYVNADFGYRLSTGNTIGGRVYLDDGQFAEPGLGGVTIALRDSNDQVIATTTSDATGGYAFPGLPAGTYQVLLTDTGHVLGDFLVSVDPEGALDGTSTVALVAGQDSLDQDFGLEPPSLGLGAGLIGDTLFLDRSGDGVPDAGEGLEGVTVRLYDDAGNTLLATTGTNENGTYAFGGLNAAATYLVRVDTGTLPNAGAGLTNTADPDGGIASQATRNLASVGPTDLAADFGYRMLSGGNTIGGTLWNDSNGNGTLGAGESGRLAGITVELRDSTGDRVGTSITDAGGNYSFPGLPNGTYTVTVTDTERQLNGWWKSDGPADGTDNNSQSAPYSVSVSGGQTDTTGDFGYYLDGAALGNRVWKDTNGDGLQQTTETTGLSDVLLKLVITYPTAGGESTVYTRSAADGGYSFANLLLNERFTGVGSGQPTYTISVVTGPSGSYQPSPVGLGGNARTDSNNRAGTAATVERGQTTVAVQASNPNGESANASYDFGYLPAALSCSVICDINSDNKVNATDLSWINARLKSKVTPAGAANSGDCVKDGKLTINDVTACRAYLTP